MTAEIADWIIERYTDQWKADPLLPPLCIALDTALTPASMLTTFLREYGRAIYRAATAPEDFDPIACEAEAIRFSLRALEDERLANLAYAEAVAVRNMARDEPYRSALKLLADEPSWRRYIKS